MEAAARYSDFSIKTTLTMIYVREHVKLFITSFAISQEIREPNTSYCDLKFMILQLYGSTG